VCDENLIHPLLKVTIYTYLIDARQCDARGEAPAEVNHVYHSVSLDVPFCLSLCMSGWLFVSL
jgi:hypothetical protein